MTISVLHGMGVYVFDGKAHCILINHSVAFLMALCYNIM